jgi:hypothetical protein
MWHQHRERPFNRVSASDDEHMKTIGPRDVPILRRMFC